MHAADAGGGKCLCPGHPLPKARYLWRPPPLRTLPTHAGAATSLTCVLQSAMPAISTHRTAGFDSERTLGRAALRLPAQVCFGPVANPSQFPARCADTARLRSSFGRAQPCWLPFWVHTQSVCNMTDIAVARRPARSPLEPQSHRCGNCADSHAGSRNASRGDPLERPTAPMATAASGSHPPRCARRGSLLDRAMGPNRSGTT
jgi:hypothetical protein